jgi:hypothetical protein
MTAKLAAMKEAFFRRSMERTSARSPRPRSSVQETLRVSWLGRPGVL